MSQPPTISIPENLLPSDGRFGSGPSNVRTSFLNDLAAAGSSFMGTSHRRTTVRDVVASIQSGLAHMYSLPSDYRVVLGVGGATMFWDAAAFGLIENHSAHFTCGEFSNKFADVVTAAPHLGQPTIVSAEVGGAPEPVAVDTADTYAYVHNETSTGVLAPFTRVNDRLVLVDGTSAAGAVPYDVEAVDCYYFSPQKALGSDGGLWITFLSPAAIVRIEGIHESGRWIPRSLSLSVAVTNGLAAQTYNTPALATLFLLEKQIQLVNDSGGIEWSASVSRASSSHLYTWAEASAYAQPFVKDIALRSPTVVTIDIADSISADDISAVLRANGIVDTESYRGLGRNQLRVATFPNIETDDVQALTACIDYITARLGT